MLPGTIFLGKYEKSVLRKAEPITVVICCSNADGIHKIPSFFVIRKLSKPRTFKNLNSLSFPMQQKSGFMSTGLFKE